MNLVESATYYLHDHWAHNVDKQVGHLALVGAPWKCIALLAAIVASLKGLEVAMATRKPLDAKPLRLVYSGFWFGVNGSGFLLGLASTEWGAHAFRCMSRDEVNLYTICLRYLGYVYLVTLVADMLYSAFDALEKKALNMAALGWQVGWALAVYGSFNFSPCGYFAFCPLAHCFVRIFLWAYQVMVNSSLDKDADYSPHLVKLDMLMAAMWTAMSIQEFYFISLPGECGHRPTALFVAFYAGAAAINQLFKLMKPE
ncbi:hypothetical protein HDE_12509 [Halotydeus destructor]|nr:hypothetical protein HDE_12509 [Halotydeus destructor]